MARTQGLEANEARDRGPGPHRPSTARLILALLLGAAALAGCDDDQPVAADGAVDATLDATIDGQPPDLGADAAIESRVRIVAPADGARLTGADDLEGEAATGVRIEVIVEAAGSDDGQVRISAAGAEEVAPIVGGEARAVVALPSVAERAVRIRAVIVSAGAAVIDEVEVTVAVRQCALAVRPPVGPGACDFGPAADRDPETPGLQVGLGVMSDCSVEVTIDGQPPIALPADADEAPITLTEAETALTFSAAAPDARPTEIGPVVYRAGLAAPILSLDLREATENVRGLESDDAVIESGRAFWRLAGASSGLAPGAEVRVIADPPLPDAPPPPRVGPDGRFTVEPSVPVGQAWVGTIAVEGVDACGTPGRSATFRLRLDALTPALRIVEPADGALLTAAADADPERADLQVPITVAVDDAREGVDYRISVACGPPGGPLVDRARRPEDAVTRATAGARAVVASLTAADAGEVLCRPIAEAAPNPIAAEDATFRLYLGRPTFRLDPPADGGCVADVLEITGVGADLDGPVELVAIVRGPGGEPEIRAPLEPVGEQRYRARIDPDRLPADGPYTVTAEGALFGALPIAIEPPSIALDFDAAPPTARFERPAEPFLSDVAPAEAGFQVAPSIEICGADGGRVTLAVDPPVPGSPFALAAPDGPGCAAVEAPRFTAPLGPVRLTATVEDRCGRRIEARRQTRIEPARVRAQIISPADGAGLTAALDDAPAAPGCQIELDGLVSGPGADARVVVCTGAGQGPADVDCPGGGRALAGPCAVMGVADAGTTLRCPVSLPDGTHRLTLAAIADARVESPPITVRADCTPPRVLELTVREDADGNGCVHRQERLNAAEAGDNARITVRFATEGLADGQAVRLRTEAGLDLGGATVTAGAGEATVSLPPGVHRLYVRGQDAAGNPLPEPGQAGVALRPIEVDTRPPTPSLIGLDAGRCLGAADDDDPGAPGLQAAIRLRTGQVGGESIAATVRVDGAIVAERSGALDVIDLALDLSDGSRAIAATVTDACGNVGSVAGFETAGALPDWRRPRPIAVPVDTAPPDLALLGIDDGAVLDAGDDADGRPDNGFQLDLAVQVDPPAGLEPGLRIDLDVDGDPALVEPSPLVVPDGFDGLLPARLTLSGGPQTVQARAVDACGNAGASAPVALTVDIPGCASRIVGFDGNPAVRGSAEPIDVRAEVDRIDLDCVGATARLVVDGAPVAEAEVPADGALTFPGVRFGEGPHTVTLRVGPVRGVTLDSPAQRVIVDLTAPAVQIDRPAGPDPAPVLTDDRPDLPGQQTAVVAAVTEARVDSPRQARLSIDGAPAGALDVPDGSPTAVTFRDVTVPAGRHTLEVCVLDAAANGACARRVVDADPAAPGAVGPVEVEVVDPRATEVALRFTAPGDDGAIGRPAGYALRRADAPFAGEADWAAAAASEVILPAAVDAGAVETLVIRGPGPDLVDGLALDRLHAVALRAVDDTGRLGPLASVAVDLRLRLASGPLAALGGAWEAGDVINTTSPVIGVGDLDRDGFDDLALAVTQSASATAAAFVFGAADGAAFETRPLARAPGMDSSFFGVVAAAAGDLNGDGAPDVAVQGYLEGFAGAAIALYFGCAAEPCDRAAIATPDALVVTVGGRFTNALAGVGDVWRPEGLAFDDLFVGGALGGERTAFVVAGRADWPALPAAVELGPAVDDPGVAVLGAPQGPAGVYAAGVGDLDGDGYADLAFSAGGDIDDSYLFFGGPWPGDALAYADGDPRTVRLVDPCPAENPSFGTAFAGGVDLDGDPEGRPDFAVGNRANKRIAVFDAARRPLDCFGRSPVQYGRFFDLAGDVDGDGAVDIVATHGDPAVTAAHIFYNDGLGRFGVGAGVSPRRPHVVLDRPARRKLGVAGAGDVDGDGRADVAAVVCDGDGVSWIVYY